jgi:hypothetical protein
VHTEKCAGDPVGAALLECAYAGFSGVLRVAGPPSGTIYLADGRVAGIETPGAPSAEVILLRTGRVPVPDWEAAFSAAAPDARRMPAELVGRGLIGAGELEAIVRIALADAMFALADGLVDDHGAEYGPADCPLPLDPGADADWLLAETSRRARALASLRDQAVQARDRFVAVPGTTRPGFPLGAGRDELLALADGRRTVRDLAFALGCGVYATMLQAARLRAEGLLVLVSHDAMSAAEEGGPWAAARGEGAETPAGLPRRRKDRPGLPRRGGEAGGWTIPATIRLLRPRTEGNKRPGESE